MNLDLLDPQPQQECCLSFSISVMGEREAWTSKQGSKTPCHLGASLLSPQVLLLPPPLHGLHHGGGWSGLSKPPAPRQGQGRHLRGAVPQLCSRALAAAFLPADVCLGAGAVSGGMAARVGCSPGLSGRCEAGQEPSTLLSQESLASPCLATEQKPGLRAWVPHSICGPLYSTVQKSQGTWGSQALLPWLTLLWGDLLLLACFTRAESSSSLYLASCPWGPFRLLYWVTQWACTLWTLTGQDLNEVKGAVPS